MRSRRVRLSLLEMSVSRNISGAWSLCNATHVPFSNKARNCNREKQREPRSLLPFSRLPLRPRFPPNTSTQRVPAHMHTRTRTHVRADAHTDTDTLTHPPTPTRTHAHANAQTREHVLSPTHTWRRRACTPCARQRGKCPSPL